MRGPEGNLSCGDSQMRTTKAYLAGLGTTGIMIGATLLLVVLGTGFAAFDSLPARGASGPALERVVVDDDALPPARHGKPLAGADRYRATPRLAVASGAKAGRRTGSGRAAREAGAGRIGGTRGWREVEPGEARDRLGRDVGTGKAGGEGSGKVPGAATPSGGSGEGSGGGASGGGGGSGRNGSDGGGGGPLTGAVDDLLDRPGQQGGALPPGAVGGPPQGAVGALPPSAVDALG